MRWASPSLSASISPSISPSTPHRLPTQKKDKKGKKGKKTDISPAALFDEIRTDERRAPDTDALFETHFWAIFPKHRHVKKADALARWRQLNPSPELSGSIRVHLEQRATSYEWTKDNGRWVPHPTTFLNGRRWEDTAIEEGPTPGSVALALTNGIGHAPAGRTAGNAAAVAGFLDTVKGRT